MFKAFILFFIGTVVVILISSLNFFPGKNVALYIFPVVAAVVFFLMFRQVYKNHRKNYQQENSALQMSNHNTTSGTDLKQFSKIPPFPVFGKKPVSEYDFYFDDQFVYAKNSAGGEKKFELKAITRLKKTSVTYSHRRLWQLNIEEGNGEELNFIFTSNTTLFNKNFKEFYQKLMQINPSVVEGNWSDFDL